MDQQWCGGVVVGKRYDPAAIDRGKSGTKIHPSTATSGADRTALPPRQRQGSLRRGAVCSLPGGETFSRLGGNKIGSARLSRTRTRQCSKSGWTTLDKASALR